MRQPIRIAVLECDTPIGKTKEKYGGYGNLFKELLENGAKKYAEANSGKVPELDISKFDVVNTEHYPSLDDVDAVLLTGSSTSLQPKTPPRLPPQELIEMADQPCREQSSTPLTMTHGS